MREEEEELGRGSAGPRELDEVLEGRWEGVGGPPLGWNTPTSSYRSSGPLQKEKHD